MSNKFRYAEYEKMTDEQKIQYLLDGWLRAELRIKKLRVSVSKMTKWLEAAVSNYENNYNKNYRPEGIYEKGRYEAYLAAFEVTKELEAEGGENE